ncbi:MAG: hypothetical protein K2Q10_01040 [Rhodospirillales bacterium]|nr:hypothetical protein [Rhodospirillales bacterium]
MSGPIDLQVKTGLNGTGQFVTDSDGNASILALTNSSFVGINVTTPVNAGARLAVKGGGSPPLIVQGDTSNYAMLGLLGDGATEMWQVQATNTAGSFFAISYPQNTQKLVILQNGNVGIGTKAPAALLDVNGTIQAKSLNVTGPLSLPGATLTITGIAPRSSAPASANIESVLVDVATGKLYYD